MAAADVYSFITQPFRFAEAYSSAVRDAFPLARAVELEGRFSNLADAQSIANVLHDILKAPRMRFEVPVLGVNVMTLSSMDGQTPAAILLADRFNLQSGRLVIIPDFTINLGAGQTILRCWG